MHGHPREHAVHKQVRSLRMQLVRDLAELRDLVGISFSDNGGAILSKPFLDRSTLVRKVFVQGRIVIPVSVLKGFERARRELFQGQIHLVRGLEPVKARALPCPEVAPVRQADRLSQPGQQFLYLIYQLQFLWTIHDSLGSSVVRFRPRRPPNT